MSSTQQDENGKLDPSSHSPGISNPYGSQKFRMNGPSFFVGDDIPYGAYRQGSTPPKRVFTILPLPQGCESQELDQAMIALLRNRSTWSHPPVPGTKAATRTAQKHRPVVHQTSPVASEDRDVENWNYDDDQDFEPIFPWVSNDDSQVASQPHTDSDKEDMKAVRTDSVQLGPSANSNMTDHDDISGCEDSSDWEDISDSDSAEVEHPAPSFDNVASLARPNVLRKREKSRLYNKPVNRVLSKSPTCHHRRSRPLFKVHQYSLENEDTSVDDNNAQQDDCGRRLSFMTSLTSSPKDGTSELSGDPSPSCRRNARRWAKRKGISIVDLTSGDTSQSVSMSLLVASNDEPSTITGTPESATLSQENGPNAIHPDRLLRASWSLVFHPRINLEQPRSLSSFHNHEGGAAKVVTPSSPGSVTDDGTRFSIERLIATRIECPLAHPARRRIEPRLIRLLFSKAARSLLKLAGSGRATLLQTKGQLRDMTGKIRSLPRKEGYFVPHG
jgi:hypothetical protein